MDFFKVILILVVCSRVNSDCQDQQSVNILWNNFPPYLKEEPGLARTTRSAMADSKGINELIQKCPQKCTKTEWIRNKSALFYHIDEARKKVHENTTMFAIPIPVEVGEEVKQHYGNDSTVDVISIREKSNLVLLVDIERCRGELTSEIFQIIRKQSPILPIMLLVAAIAGIILWVLEARQNEKEFSSSFFRGTFDGFWWAFISMTTVGYGDKTPRTVLGRVFGMIWITMGIVIISFFTATIASTITIATVEKSCHTLKNRNVAIMSNDIEVKNYVVKQGAKDTKEFDSFPAMFKAWQNKEGGINSLFVEEHIALLYFYEIKNWQKKNVRVTKSTEEVRQNHAEIILFYMVVVRDSNTTKLPCELNKTKLKQSFPHLPKPPGMYKTSFEEELDQPLSIDSPETKPILVTLSICFASLAVSGYIGIHIIKCIKDKKKDRHLDKIRDNSQEMESNSFSNRRIAQLQQSINLIAQEIKEMREVLGAH